jgi:tetratricopeptide (TPR) repeat protein
MPKIIISYRRADSGVITGRIRDRLAQHYGDDAIFMDIDNIPFGMDFRKNIAEALAKNELMLAVIGPDWLGAMPSGSVRIHDETDPVRIEVETALERGMPTIPVLVGGASMPKAEDLPDSLKGLTYHNAAEVSSGRDFHAHMDRLIRFMDAALKSKLWHRLVRLSRRQAGLGFAGAVAVIGAIAFALITRDGGPVFIGNITYIENQYLQFSGAPPTAEVRRVIVQAIELADRQQYERALEAFGKVPADTRVPAVWNDLGVVYEKLGDIANARAAYQSALAKDPALAEAKANLVRLEQAASPVAVVKTTVTGAAPAVSANDINLLAPEHGGQLLSAPSESWRKITSGQEDEWIEIRTGADSDAVYAFKDKKPARFHKLAVLIVGSNDYNPKEIEILAGDEGPNGAFRSVGNCALTNRLLFETRYQVCELTPTTARFVKLKFVSSYHFNAWAHIPQVRLVGRLAP